MASASATSLVARSVLHGAQHRGREGLESIHERQKGPTLAANLLSLSLSLSLWGREYNKGGYFCALVICVYTKKKKTEREREQQVGKIRAQQDEFERDSRSCAAQVRALQQAWRRCPTASLCLSLSLSLFLISETSESPKSPCVCHALRNPNSAVK